MPISVRFPRACEQNMEYGLLTCWIEGETKSRMSYLQQEITESVLLAYFAARGVLGPQRTPPTSSNPPHGMRMTSVMLSFPWGLWQLWKVGFSWHSMWSIFSVSPCQTVAVTEMNITAPIGSAEVLMAHWHMHFPFLLQVCSCDPFTVLFLRIQMESVEDTLEWLTTAKLCFNIYVCVVIPPHKHLT